MAPRQAKPNTPKVGRQPSRPKGQGKRPQGIKKEQLQLYRRSARLQDHQEQTIFENIKHRTEASASLCNQQLSRQRGMSLPSNYNIKLTQVVKVPQAEIRQKRKRSEDDETVLFSTVTPSQKRPRASAQPSPIENTTDERAVIVDSGEEINPLEFWRKTFRWPKKYFEPESNMNHLLTKQKSSPSLRDKQSGASSATPSDQRPREAKSTSYTRPSYEAVLATRGSFMRKFELGITDECKKLCRTLLAAGHPVS